MSKSRPLSGLQAVFSTGLGAVKWHDEATQRTPLALAEAEWASDQEVEIALGERIWAARSQLKHRVAHWMAGGSLLAVVDTDGWRVALRPRVAKAMVAHAHFVMRPASASTPPDSFTVLSMDEVLWLFGLHGAQSPGALPVKYLTARLSLKKMPQLAPERLAQRHYRLLRLLGTQPLAFEALCELLAANREDLQRDLTALYLVRAIEPLATRR